MWNEIAVSFHKANCNKDQPCYQNLNAFETILISSNKVRSLIKKDVKFTLPIATILLHFHAIKEYNQTDVLSNSVLKLILYCLIKFSHLHH